MKKSTLKKGLALIMCVALSAGITSCDSKKTNGENGKTVVTVWTGNGHDKLFLAEKIKDWNDTTGEANNIKIDYVVQEGNLSEKIALAFETNQAPDLFAGVNLEEYVQKGYVAPYDDIEGIDGIMEHYSKYAMHSRHTYDGKMYSLPRGAGTYGLIYNKDMFRAAGIVDENGEPTPPETLDQLREYAKRLTNPSKMEYGIIFPGKFTYWYGDDVMKMASASCGYVDGYNPKTGTFDFSAEAKVMETIMGIKEDKSYYPGVEGLDNDPARARFAAGGVGMKTAGSYDYGVLTTQFPAEIDWGVAPFPVADANDKHLQYMGNGAYLLINKNSAEEKNAAIGHVLNFFYGDELIIDAYKAGIELPIDWDMVKDIELDPKLEQWKGFAELVAISHDCPLSVKTDLQATDTVFSFWNTDVWPGNVPKGQIASKLQEFADKYNESAKAYQEANPDYDPSPFIIEDWDSKR